MTLLHPTTRAAWRSWLAANHDRETEIWLVYNKRHTGEPRVEYDDAVEEAVCFGWIDSIVRTIDENRYAQKFTPRKAKSKWSVSNIERFARMVREGKMTPAGMAKSRPDLEDPAGGAGIKPGVSTPGTSLPTPPIQSPEGAQAAQLDPLAACAPSGTFRYVRDLEEDCHTYQEKARTGRAGLEGGSVAAETWSLKGRGTERDG